MTKRQLVVLSCDALAVTALSAYGSSWNETQQLEHLATRAVVWDRVITSTDETQEQLRRIWEPLLQANGARFLRSELILAKGEQASRLVSVAEQVGFDQCTLVDTEAPEVDELVSQPPRFSDDDSADNDSAGTETDDEDELEATAIAKLLSTAIERVAEGSSTEPAGESQDNRLVWIHSDLLTRVWDAPHWLFPVDDEEQGEAIEAPEDRTEWSLDDFSSDWLSPAEPAPSSDHPVQRVVIKTCHRRHCFMYAKCRTYRCQSNDIRTWCCRGCRRMDAKCDCSTAWCDCCGKPSAAANVRPRLC